VDNSKNLTTIFREYLNSVAENNDAPWVRAFESAGFNHAFQMLRRRLVRPALTELWMYSGKVRPRPVAEPEATNDDDYHKAAIVCAGFTRRRRVNQRGHKFWPSRRRWFLGGGAIANDNFLFKLDPNSLPELV